jgi:hypothetical protein
VVAAATPRKRKRRRAHAPAGPVVVEPDEAGATDAAPLDDDSASATARAETAPKGEGTPAEADNRSGEATTDHAVEPHPDDASEALDDPESLDESKPLDESDASDATDAEDTDADGVDGAGPANGRPAPTNGQPRRGFPVVPGAVATPAARRVSAVFRPRSSARGR